MQTEEKFKSGDFSVTVKHEGMVVRSPDGSLWRVEVDNFGMLTPIKVKPEDDKMQKYINSVEVIE